MTGADVIGELLRGNASLTEIVPEARIKAGRLPDDAALPVLLVRVVSSIERQRLKRGPLVRVVDRVSVTVRAANYADQVRIIELATDASAGALGTIADALNVSVLTAGRGPDVAGPGDSFEQAQDLRVTFDRPVQRGD